MELHKLIKKYDKKNKYSIIPLLKTEAQYMMLLGKRANGKSFQVKLTVLIDAYKNNRKFVYLRRWREDIKVKAIDAYFNDMPIKKITEGEYDGVMAYSGNIYFYTVDEVTGKRVRSDSIGIYGSLNEAERYKSWSFPDYDYILYEEFITDKIYLDDEPSKLQQFVSTVARDRKITVMLIGNTLSRVCPYFFEWCLEGVLKQKQGTIEIYHFHVGKSVINIAVENCANNNEDNKMFFGHTAKQIVSGEWDTRDLPKLPKKQYEYEEVYELAVVYQSFKFAIKLLVGIKDGGIICFVHPVTSKKKFDRIITDKISDSPYITSVFLKNKPETMIANCLKNNKTYYSDNLTGADFQHVIEEMGI